MHPFKSIGIIFCFLMALTKLYAQPVILELESPNSGLLIPRTDTSNITNPPKGLLILDTASMTFYVYDGMSWQYIPTQSAFKFFYADRDGDTYGDKFSAVYAVGPPMGYVENNLDCDDSDTALNLLQTWYLDTDGDLYGNPDSSMVSCAQPAEYVLDNTDCDDNNMDVNPGSPEICDGIDNNCDSLIDEPDENGCPCDEFEPNNVCVEAIDLGSFTDSEGRRDTISGTISPGGDENDYFMILALDDMMEPAETYNVDVRLIVDGGNQIELEVTCGSCYDPPNGCADHYNSNSFYDIGDPMSDDTRIYYIRIYKHPAAYSNCIYYEFEVSNGYYAIPD